MGINFPSAVDALTNPTSTDALNSPAHATQHADANDAIEALETKVGINSSAVTTTLDYLLKSTSSTDPGHKHTKATITDLSVASGADITTGTDDAKYVTSKAIQDAKSILTSLITGQKYTIQWGSNTIGPIDGGFDGDLRITFPTAFSTACSFFIGQIQPATSWIGLYVRSCFPEAKTSGIIHWVNGVSSQNITFYWLAIGY
jgi:hypothetical protein